MGDVVRTQRLVLRPLEASDVDRVYTLFANWNVIRRLSAPPWPYTLQDARTFVGRMARHASDLTQTGFAIVRGTTLIGGIDIRTANTEPRRSGPVIGYWLGEEYWGQGYMTEAARGFLVHVFTSGISDVICSGAFADNTASLRVQDKLGFVREGDTMMYAKPRGAEFKHVNTVLTREAFEDQTRLGARSPKGLAELKKT